MPVYSEECDLADFTARTEWILPVHGEGEANPRRVVLWAQNISPGDPPDSWFVEAVLFDNDGNDLAVANLGNWLRSSFSTSEGAGPQDEIAALSNLRAVIDELITARQREIDVKPTDNRRPARA